ncbi:Plexin-A2, partial [Clarias magur]
MDWDFSSRGRERVEICFVMSSESELIWLLFITSRCFSIPLPQSQQHCLMG